MDDFEPFGSWTFLEQCEVIWESNEGEDTMCLVALKSTIQKMVYGEEMTFKAIPIIDYFMEGCYQQSLNLVVNQLRLKFVGIALEWREKLEGWTW